MTNLRVHARLGLVAALLAIVCSSCTSMGTVDGSVPPPDMDHAYFLIGVEPVDARVFVFKGNVHGGRWFKEDPFAVSSFYGNPVDGFVLGDTHAGTTLAIMDVAIAAPGSVFGSTFTPDCEKTLVFTAPGGKVVYVGSAQYTPVGGRVAARYYNRDLGTARAFLEKHYPKLANLLEAGSHQVLPASTGLCSD